MQLRTPTPESATALADRIRGGDREAFQRFSSEVSPRLLRHALARLNGDHDTARDLVQQTLVALWEQRTRLPAESPRLMGYAAGTLLNLLRQYARTERLRRRHEAARPARIEWQTPSREPLETVAAMEVWELAMQLPDAQRDVVVNRFGRGLSLQETADELGLPVGTVSTRQREGLARLRRQLAAHAGLMPAVAASLFGSEVAAGRTAAAGGGRAGSTWSLTRLAAVMTASSTIRATTVVVLVLLAITATVLLTNALGDPGERPPVPQAAAPPTPANPQPSADPAPTPEPDDAPDPTDPPADTPAARTDPRTDAPEVAVNGGVLEVEVVDPNGNPMADVSVWQPEHRGDGIKKTDADGFARLPLPVGEERAVRVWASTQHDHVNLTIVALPDAPVRHRVIIRPLPAGSVTGTARRIDGTPFADVRVRLWRSLETRSDMTYSVRTDDSGGYHFPNVLAGRYRLAVGGYISPDGQTEWFEVTGGAIIQRNVTQQVLSGWVVDHLGRPVPDLRLRMCRFNPDDWVIDADGNTSMAPMRMGAVGMRDEDGETPRVTNDAFTRTDLDGRFSFGFVPFVGEGYCVSFILPEELAGCSIHPHGQMVLQAPRLAGEGQQRMDIRLPAPLARGEIAGVVQDLVSGELAEAGTVRLERIGETGDAAFVRLLAITPDGRFHCGDLAPGRYTVTAEWSGHAQAAPCEVDLAPQGAADCAVEMAPGADLRIELVRTAGRLLDHGHLRLSVPGWPEPERELKLHWSSHNEMVFRDVPLGVEVRLQIVVPNTSPGYEPIDETFVFEGEVFRRDLVRLED